VGVVLTEIAVTTAKCVAEEAVRYGLSIVGGSMLPVMCSAILRDFVRKERTWGCGLLSNLC
jgi:hypothetical protein